MLPTLSLNFIKLTTKKLYTFPMDTYTKILDGDVHGDQSKCC